MPTTKSLDCQKNFCRERLKPPAKFDRRSFRTVPIKKNGRPTGKLLVVGCPVGKWQPRKRECSGGTQAQTLLRPLGDKKCRAACGIRRRRRR